MQHAITIADVLKVSGAALLIIIPISLVVWFLSTIDFSK